MPAIASTDIAVVITSRVVAGRRKTVVGTIAFGDGSLTYATGGVPMPVIARLGLSRNLDSMEIVGSNVVAAEYLERYDKTNHKLALYYYDGASAGKAALEQLANAATPAARTYAFVVRGWS